MKAKKLCKILKKFPDAEIRVWDDANIKTEITFDDDGVIINLKKKTV